MNHPLLREALVRRLREIVISSKTPVSIHNSSSLLRWKSNINYRWFDMHVVVLVIPLFCSVHQCGTPANVVSSTGSGMSDQQPCLSEHVN